MIRKLVALLVVMIMSIGTCVIHASAATIIMDNDALASSGTSNPKKEGEMYGWYGMDYMTSGDCYNGDARIGSSWERNDDGGYGSRYCWQHYIPSGRQTLSAYLWDVEFTDPKANYYILSTLNGTMFGTLNQDRAAYGWNVVGTASPTLSLYGVTSSGAVGTYLGADAIRITY